MRAHIFEPANVFEPANGSQEKVSQEKAWGTDGAVPDEARADALSPSDSVTAAAKDVLLLEEELQGFLVFLTALQLEPDAWEQTHFAAALGFMRGGLNEAAAAEAQALLLSPSLRPWDERAVKGRPPLGINDLQRALDANRDGAQHGKRTRSRFLPAPFAPRIAQAPASGRPENQKSAPWSQTWALLQTRILIWRKRAA